jgi:hypothetical protein
MHCQRQGHKKHEPGLEVESAGATKSNRVVSVQTHMRRANLGNMFAPLLASGWINQPHVQTPLQQLMLKSEKYFMKLVRHRRAAEDTIISLAPSVSSVAVDHA